MSHDMLWAQLHDAFYANDLAQMQEIVDLCDSGATSCYLLTAAQQNNMPSFDILLVSLRPHLDQDHVQQAMHRILEESPSAFGRRVLQEDVDLRTIASSLYWSAVDLRPVSIETICQHLMHSPEGAEWVEAVVDGLHEHISSERRRRLPTERIERGLSLVQMYQQAYALNQHLHHQVGMAGLHSVGRNKI